MSDLFDRFTGLRTFVNPLQDDLINIYVAFDELDNAVAYTPNEVVDIINGVDVSGILNRYSSRSSGLMNYSYRMRNRMNSINFTKFKGLTGGIVYV